MKWILPIYRFIFVRRAFFRLNRALYLLALRGIGILNYENSSISGEHTFLKRFCRTRKGAVIFDVGANIGSYSKMVRNLDAKSNVHAFEPNPAVFGALENCARQFEFHANHLALGDALGKINLFLHPQADRSEHASVYRSVIEDIHGSSAIMAEVVISTVDDYAAFHAVSKIDLLKIDTEGHELSVLQGARRMLNDKKIEVIHFEFNEMNVASRIFLRDFWSLLSDYRIYRMFPDGLLEIQNYSAPTCEIFAYQNIVAIHNSSDLHSKL